MQNNLHGTWVAAFPLPLRRMIIEAVCSPVPPLATCSRLLPLRRAVPTRQQQSRASPQYGVCGERRCFSSGRPAAVAAAVKAVRSVKTGKAVETAKTTKAAKTDKTVKSAKISRPAQETPAPRREEVVRSLAYVPGSSSSAAGAADAADAADAASTSPTAVAAPMPSGASLDRATALFLQPAPRFLYSAPRFLNLPVNTRMPEVCILGRSNVGKSTLLNALAGLETGGRAGHSHGARPGRAGLAITSPRAGCTVMMNGYGFGPPLRPGTVDLGRDGSSRDGRESRESSDSRLLSRSQRRAQKPGEPAPAHSLVLLDMPGYGFMSRSEWGVEIAKYLQRRTALRGAVLLVDAVAGIKDGDRQALAMLRDARVRTMVVLTKADKLVSPRAGEGESHEGDESLRQSCLRVWETLREIEEDGKRASWDAEAAPWMEGQGWDRAVLVTGAGDPKGGGFGVAGTRLAICRMAGLVQAAARGKAAKTKPAAEASRSGSRGDKEKHVTADDVAANIVTVVPFDQIRWAETSTDVPLDQSEEHQIIADMAAARQEQKAQASRAASGRARPWRRRAAGRSSPSREEAASA